MSSINTIAPIACAQAHAAHCEALFSTCIPHTWAEVHEGTDGAPAWISVRDRSGHFARLDDALRQRIAAQVPAMLPEQVEPAPALDIDAQLFAPATRYAMERRHMGERAVVWNLLQHMARHGWRASSVNDGEGVTLCASPREVMEIVFNLDESAIRFRKGAGKVHVVCIVLGNSPHEVVSDHSAPDDTSEGFQDAINAFCPEYLFPEFA